jgi:predicted DNA-binding protein (UPF0251 family)
VKNFSMPRTKRLRKIVAPPAFSSFKPIGAEIEPKKPVDLLYEEYEAINLSDYRLMNHKDAAVLMGVSRPTFARIYESARRKVAKALVEVRELNSSYGNAWMESGWLRCMHCLSKFTMPLTISNNACPLCKSTKLEPINE